MLSKFFLTATPFLVLLLLSFKSPKTFIKQENTPPQLVKSNSKIQVALLLDVSNSMDGLINQAKDQLWTMVKVLGKVQCNGINPQIEIALYEYGRSSNSADKGYVKQIEPFTSDLDKLYNSLYQLSTQGGEEYCGYVIKTSLDELSWDTTQGSYKAIFIAGNESFQQGSISFTHACAEAKLKKVIVNTIYCGKRERGIQDNWELGAECGNGSFTNIDQDAIHIPVPSPYDTTLYVLNTKLRNTLLPYGNIPEYDTVPEYNTRQIDKIIGYVVVKSDKNLYNRNQWDLVDAAEKDNSIIDKVDMTLLPDSLQTKPRSYIKKLVQQKSDERELIRKEIKRLDLLRDSFIKQARMAKDMPKTLESVIENIIRNQVGRVNMKMVENTKGF